MSFASFYSCNLTNSNQNKGGRSASEEIDYLEKESSSGKSKDIDNEQDENENEQNAKTESEYIVGKTRRREDLALLKTGNMPEWAREEAKKNGTEPHLEFFKASETYEAPKNVTYREIKFALPQEFIDINDKQEIDTKRLEQLVDDYMNRIGLDKMTYAYAIHIKNAQLSPDDKNVHVHIMWSDRIPDGIERSKEQYFGWGEDKRYRAKHPELGPCKKDNTYSEYNGNTNRIRKICEETINEHYEKYGIERWVCCGNKAEIQLQAEMRGDYAAAEIARDVKAQTHVGEKAAANPNNRRTREAMELKKQAQAIRDKYKQIKIEHQEFGTPSPLEQYEKLSDNMEELQKQLSDINRRMTDIKNLYFEENPETDTTEKSDSQNIDKKISEDINSLQAEIILTQKRVTLDTHHSALRMYCKDNNLKDEFIKYSTDKKSLESKQNLVAKIEQQITNKFFKNSENSNVNSILVNEFSKDKNTNFNPEEHCSQAQKFLLQNTKKQIIKLEKSTLAFTEKYITPNLDKIAPYEKKAIARNEGNKNKIIKLQAQITELQTLSPEAKEMQVTLNKEKELNNLIAKSLKSKPIFYKEPEKYQQWKTEREKLLQQKNDIQITIKNLQKNIQPETPSNEKPIHEQNQPNNQNDIKQEIKPEQQKLESQSATVDKTNELYIEADKLNHRIERLTNEIKMSHIKIEKINEQQQLIINDPSELNAIAIANLSKISLPTVKDTIKALNELEKKYLNEKNEYNKKPSFIFKSETKLEWKMKKDTLDITEERYDSMKQKYNTILSKIGTSATDISQKIDTEKRDIPKNLESDFLKIQSDTNQKLSTMSQTINDANSIEKQLLAEIDRPDKLKIVGNFKEFDTKDALKILNNEIFKLNHQKNNTKDKSIITKIDKRITDLDKVKDKIERQMKFDQRHEAKTGKKLTYRVASPSPGSSSNSPSPSKPTDLNAVLRLFDGLSNPAITPLVAYCEDGKSYDFEAMTDEQKQTAIAEIQKANEL